MKVMLVNSSDPARWGGAEVWMAHAMGVLADLGHACAGLARAASPALRAAGGREWSGSGAGLAAAAREFRPDVSVALQHRDLRLLWGLGEGRSGRRAMARFLVPRRPSLKRRLYYRAMCRSVWVPSEHARERIAGLDRVPRERVHVIPHSVTVPAAPRPDPAGAPTLLFVGRLAREKGADVLLEARARMRVPARMIVIGRGSEESALRARAEALGLGSWIEWHAHVPDLAPFLERAHVAVCPSRMEASGLFALEAMARGVPVAAARAGGLPEIVGDGGALVPAEDPAALALALDRLLASREERLALAARAHRRALEVFTPGEEQAALRRALEGTLA